MRAGQLPECVEAEDEAGFESSGSDLGEQRPAGRPESQRGDHEPGGRPGCLLPVQGEVDHSSCQAARIT
jgi:hypothetical protein